MAENKYDIEQLLQLMACEDGKALLNEESAWESRVPAGVDEAAKAAKAAAAAGTAAPWLAPAKAATTIAKRIAAGVAAVAVITGISAAAYRVSPSLREAAAPLLSSLPFVSSLAGEEAAPGDYIIPSPGEGFAVSEEFSSDTLVYRWFKSEDADVLVQVAYVLPQIGAQDAESIQVGALQGICASADGSTYVEMRDGDILIRIVWSGSDREALLAYADTFEAANSR